MPCVEATLLKRIGQEALGGVSATALSVEIACWPSLDESRMYFIRAGQADRSGMIPMRITGSEIWL